MNADEKLTKNTKKIKTRPTQSYYIPPAQRTTTNKKISEESIPSIKKTKNTSKDTKTCSTKAIKETSILETTEAVEENVNIYDSSINHSNSSQLTLPVLKDRCDADQNLALHLDQNNDNSEESSDKNADVSVFHIDNITINNEVVNQSPTLQTKIELQDLRVMAELMLEEFSTNKNLIKPLTSREKKIEKIIDFLNKLIIEEKFYESEQNNCAIFQENIKETLKQRFLTNFKISDLDSSSDEEINECDRLQNLKLSTDSDLELSVVPSPEMHDIQILNIEEPREKPIEEKPPDTIPLLICYSEEPVKKNEESNIDNENEEMKRAIANINRRRRSLIKHVHNDNTLVINEEQKISSETYSTNNQLNIDFNNIDHEIVTEQQNNLSNWEDMFDENGDLHTEYVGEIVKQIGYEVKVVKASHDYSDYQNPKYQDLEHVIELYDFSATLKTQDIMQLYRSASQEPMYVKWCDDTHCLLVLSTPAQAQRALQIDHGIIKSRSLSQASSIAAKTASSCDLKPAMKRPATTMLTARRLINTYLGTKSTLSKKEIEEERQALRDAREQRRLERQNEKDAWEGHPRNAKS